QTPQQGKHLPFPGEREHFHQHSSKNQGLVAVPRQTLLFRKKFLPTRKKFAEIYATVKTQEPDEIMVRV
ncbi:MAG: hypothetical protein KGO94_09665, partial [Alphaproteobacteria bacterium]|nr:hypothetical protein [Alphaproteobacteria bacterium]